MAEYIERGKAIDACFDGWNNNAHDCAENIRLIPAADVLPRDEAIKMGAELAAMHGSDATSQELEKAYLEGVAYGMKRRDVKPVARGKWEKQDANLVWNAVGLYAAAYKCNRCGELNIAETYFCPNCGADMREES